MTEDTYKYTTTQPIDEQLSNLIEIQQMHRKPLIHESDLLHIYWTNKRIQFVKRLQKSSVLVEETETDILLYHYELPSREWTYLTLIEPGFVRDLDERTEYLLLHHAASVYV